jgi:hypothetical protein
MVIAKRKFSRVRMQCMGATIAHFTDFCHIVMSTSRYLLYARTWNTKSTVACLAKGIHCKKTQEGKQYLKMSIVNDPEVSVVCGRRIGREGWSSYLCH